MFISTGYVFNTFLCLDEYLHYKLHLYGLQNMWTQGLESVEEMFNLIFRLETSKRISNLFGHQGFLQVILKTIDAMESSPKSHKRKEAYMLMFLLMMIFLIWYVILCLLV
ncbi:hypothetical protein Hanom_Chr01g00066801 [Helianthus anomalus]